jgi:uncharacterized membrane protein
MKFETTIEINAPADAVWDVLQDVERWPEWTQSIDAVELVGGGPLAVGSAVKIRQPRLPLATWTVTDVRPGCAFTWVATAPGVHSTATHEITATGNGAVTARLDLDQRGPLGWLIGTVYGRMTRRYIGMEAAGLKARSEAAAT